MTYLRSLVVVSLLSVASLAGAACSSGGDGGEGGAGIAAEAGAGGKGQSSASSSASHSASHAASSSASTSGVSASSSVSASASSSASGGAGVSFAIDVQPLFTKSCLSSGCHGATAAKGLDLSTNKAYQELVGVKAEECAAGGGRQLVVAGNPDQSYLIDKLKGTNLCSGVRMPAKKPALADAEIQTIADWITAGAMDN
jgi:hypothetical protein